MLVGASPRGSLALLLTARSYAVIQGRDYVVPEDVKAVAIPALAHRITVRPELWLHEVTGATVVRTVLGSVPAPPTVVGARAVRSGGELAADACAGPGGQPWPLPCW